MQITFPKFWRKKNIDMAQNSTQITGAFSELKAEKLATGKYTFRHQAK